MDLYEEKNTRMLIDVNTGEDDIVNENGQTVDTETAIMHQKLTQVKETIKILKARKIEQEEKFEYLNAPKRAAKKSHDQNKDKKKKGKTFGNELTFQTDH